MKTRIILIHGFLERSSMWEPLLPLPADAILNIELPGHGDNKRHPEVLNMEYAADFVAAKLQNDTSYRNLFIGHSMGGYISAAFVKKYPDLVDGIVLFQSKAGADNEQQKITRERAASAVRENRSRYCRTMIAALFNEKNQVLLADRIKKLSEEASSMSTEAILAAINGMKLRDDNVSNFRERDFFLAYVLGDEDSAISLDYIMTEIDQVKPDAYKVIEDCGHMAQWEKPEEARDSLLEIIRQFDEISS